jgi:hypothetical protein
MVMLPRQNHFEQSCSYPLHIEVENSQIFKDVTLLLHCEISQYAKTVIGLILYTKISLPPGSEGVCRVVKAPCLGHPRGTPNPKWGKLNR